MWTGGAADGAGSPRTAGDGQRARDSETRGADVSEAEFAAEAQKAQEQTQARGCVHAYWIWRRSHVCLGHKQNVSLRASALLWKARRLSEVPWGFCPG